MPFIGIISNEDTENCIRDCILDRTKLRESSVLFIKEKSIENIKNIKFETIIVDRSFKKSEILKKMIDSANYLIINSDIESNLDLLNNVNTTVISYGFNSKATITASSVGENEMLICVQRAIEGKNNNVIEPEEFNMEIYKNANCTMALAGALLIYDKI